LLEVETHVGVDGVGVAGGFKGRAQVVAGTTAVTVGLALVEGVLA
jgi:hypothetical protein